MEPQLADPDPPLDPTPIAMMSMLLLRRRPFSTMATLEDAGEAEEGGGVVFTTVAVVGVCVVCGAPPPLN